MVDLFGQRSDVHPAVIGPEDANHRRHHPREDRSVQCRWPERLEVLRTSSTQEHRQHHQSDDPANLEDRTQDLERASAARAEDIDGRDDGNGQHGRGSLPDVPVHPGGRRNKLHEVAGEGGGQGGHRARPRHRELGPAKQEGGNRPVRGAEVYIRPPRMGHHRPELGQRQSAGRAEDASHDPDQSDSPDERDVTGHGGRDEENPRTDHASHDDAIGRDRPQHPRQLEGSFDREDRSSPSVSHPSSRCLPPWAGSFPAPVVIIGRAGGLPTGCRQPRELCRVRRFLFRSPPQTA